MEEPEPISAMLPVEPKRRGRPKKIIPEQPDVTIRSQKRKSLHPDALFALQSELKIRNGAESGSPNGAVTEALIPAVPDESHSSPPRVIKRLRNGREIQSTPLPPMKSRLRNVSNAAEVVRLANKAVDLPPSDFEFTGSSSSLSKPATAEETQPAVDGHPKRKKLVFSAEVQDNEAKSAAQPAMETVNITMRQIPASEIEKKETLKIMSWNIAGLGSFLSKNTWKEINQFIPEIICLQETKVQSTELLEQLGVHVGASHTYWHQGAQKGHAGVAILSKTKPKSVVKGIPRPSGNPFGEKGNVLTAEYEDFYVVNAYVPNSSVKLKNLQERLLWDVDFRAFLKDLQEKKPVIVAGDLNCALTELDIANVKSNLKNPGFTLEERASLSTTIRELDLVDVYRERNPGVKGGYTFWSSRSGAGIARQKNIGWRLDYFLASRKILPLVEDVKHLRDVLGSDHCPIMLYLKIVD